MFELSQECSTLLPFVLFDCSAKLIKVGNYVKSSTYLLLSQVSGLLSFSSFVEDSDIINPNIAYYHSIWRRILGGQHGFDGRQKGWDFDCLCMVSLQSLLYLSICHMKYD